jgi:hypothetical protein
MHKFQKNHVKNPEKWKAKVFFVSYKKINYNFVERTKLKTSEKTVELLNLK